MVRYEWMKQPITNRAEAEKYIKQMVDAGLAYHWDDDPADIYKYSRKPGTFKPGFGYELEDAGPVFNSAEIPLVRARALEMEKLEDMTWNDVFAYTLSLTDPDRHDS